MRIACLHTAESNITVFESAASSLGIPLNALQHEVRPDLLAEAEHAGEMTSLIVTQTQLALTALAQNADAVILTCSTLGPAVDGIADSASIPIIRTDAALADAAARVGGKIIVLCAVQTTMEPTSKLFREAIAHTDASVEIHLVPDAWTLFKAGNIDGYLSAIAKAADAAYINGASIVALAQSSMRDAAMLVSAGPRPLDSPTAGVAAVIEQCALSPTKAHRGV